MIKRFFVIALLACCAAAPVMAVDGISLDPSQSIYSGRQLGMGGVSVAFSDDASGIFTNPAGLTKHEFPQLIGASRKLVLDETVYTLFGWTLPTQWGTFGLGYTGMNTGGSYPTKLDPATNRIIIDPSREAMSYDNSVVALSYSRQVREDLSLGGNLKFFNQSLSGDVGSSANATGIDLSASYQPLAWLTVGANLQNLIEGNLAWSGGASDKIGGFYKLGVKLNILGSSEVALREHDHQLFGGIDIDIPHSTLTSTNYHLGVEYFPLEKIALRAGINMGQSGAGLTFGVGLTNGGFRFDYAFAQRPGIPGDMPHYFSLSYVGERVLNVFHKLKQKESGINWLEPKDRYITDRSDLPIIVEVREKRIMDQKKVWVVTGMSETSEASEAVKYKDLSPVFLNGIKVEQTGTIETSSPLAMGRNVFEVVGYGSDELVPGSISPEVFAASSEVRVLRFKPFADTPMSHWAIEPIALSVTLGLVKGYPDDTFRPEKGITRAELVTLLVRSMPVSLAEEISYAGFKDVSNKHWAAKYIAYGSYKGLVTGYPDGTFKPNKVLTRAEGITVLARYANLVEETNVAPPFPDLNPDFWANKYIAAAKKSGMLQYLVGKDFEPPTPFTRAEATEVFYRTPPVQQGVDQFWDTGVISAEQTETQTATSEAQ
ncbi:MAG: PorV/PorQ family protein [Candidatus Margulisiibacteriota bacterium]